ncbi:MAG TPA: SusF/SusE family outer membrane protein [Saprospiraceae bacterium]|mgnify:CR=1 FL=1|nr:SusF/SusE family outer membrane protein [Saprospiraceae bacterium]HMQ82661.1 SusF/SusE family outer membrane protein [Saprospiraceae bacterium]
MTRLLKYSFIFFGALVLFNTCSKDELDINALTDFPPGILSISPADGGKVVIGDFNIKVDFVDGSTSPLTNGSVKLSDDFGNELANVEKALSGTSDSIVIEGASFNASLLGPGTYRLNITVTDSKGQSSEKATSFEITSSAFASIQSEMYLAGGYNGWGADALTLVADYTWELQGIDLMGGEWKLKNTVDWTDTDWGDPDCDGIVEVTSGGGANTNCPVNGLVNFRFNDLTLQYTIVPAVNIKSNISGLYVLGSMNDFQGADYPFTLVSDNTWVLPEIELTAGDKFRLAEYPNFMGRNWGDPEFDGIAELFGDNITFPADSATAVYSITFNDETLEYSIEFVRGEFPTELYLVGGLAAHGAWTPSASIPFRRVADGVFEIYAPLETGTGFKFLQVQDWAGDWGADPANPGMIVQEGEQDAMIGESGFYLIRVDFSDKTVAYTKTDWAIIGDATAGGWDVDTDMTFQNDFEWTITLDLGTGFVKFRANDEWPINFGDNEPDGDLDSGGSDIPIAAAGNYTVTMSLHPSNGYTYTITLN